MHKMRKSLFAIDKISDLVTELYAIDQYKGLVCFYFKPDLKKRFVNDHIIGTMGRCKYIHVYSFKIYDVFW